MNEPLVYWNQALVPLSEARLPLNDAGLVFGATVTDLCRTFRHQLFRLGEHLSRFRASCRLAQVPLPTSDTQLTQAAEKLVQHNAALIGAGQELALVLIATPGPIGYYLGQPGGAGDGEPTLVMHTFPLPFQRFRQILVEGARLITPSVRQPAVETLSPLIKHRSRLHWWLAECEVHAIDPRASALLLDADGRITETAAANLVLVRDGAVCSPRRDCILNGISLLTVEELCGGLGIGFMEKDLVLADILAAEEVFLTNTSYCLAPVTQVNGRPVAGAGPTFERLLGAWSSLVGVDIRGQILQDVR